MSMNQNDIKIQQGGNLVQQGNPHGTRFNFFEKYALIVTIVACLICGSESILAGLVILAAFAVLILKPEYLLGPVLFFTIFDDYLLVTHGTSISRFLTLYFIAGTVLLILKKGVIKKETLFLIVLIFVGVFFSLTASMGHTSLPISYILNVLLAIALVNVVPNSNEQIAKQLYKYALLAVVYVYYMLALNGFDTFVDGERMTIAEEVNSNQLAMGLAVVMALLASNLLIFGKNKLFNIFLLLANCVALFLSGSRTGLIAGVLATFLIYIIGTNKKGNRKKAIVLSFASLAVLALIYSYMQENFPLLMERFTVDNIEETGGTGRIDVWKAYFRDYFPKYWLTGIGFDAKNMYYAILASNGEGHGAHNVIVEILSKTGMIGAVLYFTCFTKYFSMVLKSLRENKYILCSAAIFLSIMLDGIGEDVLTTRFLWFGIGLGYMFINASNREQELVGGENGIG